MTKEYGKKIQNQKLLYVWRLVRNLKVQGKLLFG